MNIQDAITVIETGLLIFTVSNILIIALLSALVVSQVGKS